MGHVSQPKTNSQQFTGLIAPLVAAGPHPNIALEETDSLGRTDIKWLAEHISGATPPTASVTPIVPQHCHLPPLLSPASSLAGAQLYEPQVLDNANLAASLH
jgi:hypothetical protein